MDVIKTPSFILKAVQLICAIVCTGLSEGVAGGTNGTKTVYINVIFCGYILILVMDMSRILSGGTIRKELAIFWSFAGGILWITAGALVIEFYKRMDDLWPDNVPKPSVFDQVIASGVIALLNGLVFFAEAAVTFKAG